MNKESFNKKYKLVKPFLVIGLVLGILFGYNASIPKISYEPSWHIVFEGNLAQAGEGDPGTGAGGILEIFFYPHTATPGTTYAENNSATLEAASLGWANADDFNVELPHSTAFDPVVRVRGNKTQCWRVDKFYDSDLRVRWTCTDLGVSSDTVMTGVVTYNNTSADFLWMNFYHQGSGSGFTLSKDQTASIQSIKFEAYY